MSRWRSKSGYRIVFLVWFLAALNLRFVAGPTDTRSSSSNLSGTTLRLPAAVVFDGTVGPDQAVFFRHETHADGSPGNCLACHPEPFRMLQPVRATSHEVMNAGKSCGKCHDGKLAFGVEDADGCARCHAGRGGPS